MITTEDVARLFRVPVWMLDPSRPVPRRWRVWLWACRFWPLSHADPYFMFKDSTKEWPNDS